MTTPHLTPETLTDYVHGELAPAEDSLALAHLDACPACRRELEAETSLTEGLRAAAAAETFDLPDTVKAAIRREARRPRVLPFALALAALRPAFALPAAAAILIGTLAFPTLLHTLRPAQPTIDAAFYLDAHAAQQATEPFAEHNTLPASTQTAYDDEDTAQTTAYASAQDDANDIVR